MEAVLTLSKWADLVAYVHKSLCEPDELLPEVTPLFRTPLTRRGRTTGYLFHVEGPRLLRTSAVWAADEARILFYDSTGARQRAVRLSESPTV